MARIPLPPHLPDGGFDHAVVDSTADRLYVAHPSVDAVEVIDLARRKALHSIHGLCGAAGVWLDEPARFLFSSNRRENTVSVFRLHGEEREIARIATGARPNGLAVDPQQRLLMIAGVGEPKLPDAPPTLNFVRANAGRVIAQLHPPGRTRWCLYHAPTRAFYVNVADPPCVLRVPAEEPFEIEQVIPIPGKGPHGLEQDADGRTLYVACDDGQLFPVDLTTTTVGTPQALSGPPDVLWIDRDLGLLYAAIGDPGAVDVFRLGPLSPTGSLRTGPGAHTLTVDPKRHDVHVFLPETHEDLILGPSP